MGFQRGAGELSSAWGKAVEQSGVKVSCFPYQTVMQLVSTLSMVLSGEDGWRQTCSETGSAFITNHIFTVYEIRYEESRCSEINHLMFFFYLCLCESPIILIRNV